MAKNLDAAHEGYRIDHIIKERYPVFGDAIRDLDDALSLIILFSNLPSTNHISPKVIANCTRLAAEWQVYVIKSRSLKHAFLSIKGIYYQAEIEGQPVTWLVPYSFTQTIPHDVDFRIMLTFLELYQTLLGFVFYRLFQSINLVYPPKLDFNQDEAGAGLDALILESNDLRALIADQDTKPVTEDKITQSTVKAVREEIKSLISAQADSHLTNEETNDQTNQSNDPREMEIDNGAIENSEEDALFKPYKFFLSREVPRSMLEFVVKCGGGEVGWDPTLGAGSPYLETDSRITHHVVDRPALPPSTQNLPQRAFIQPQWVVDCFNKSKLLPADEYAPGKILPPHLSPFVDDEEVRRQGGYLPEEVSLSNEVGDGNRQQEEDAEEEEEEGEGEDEDSEEREQAVRLTVEKDVKTKPQERPALLAAASNMNDEDLVHAAEIEAEELGISHAQFEKDLRQKSKEISKSKSRPSQKSKSHEDDDNDHPQMAEMLLSSKQRKLYSKMNYTKQQRAEEKRKLESKKKKLLSTQTTHKKKHRSN